jgi:hypothetical protein
MAGVPEPGLAPAHLWTVRHEDPVVRTVDGQRFRVAARADDPGTYDFDWLSGPHGYGFGLTRSDGAGMTEPELVAAIREFLAGIDPDMGYLTG